MIEHLPAKTAAMQKNVISHYEKMMSDMRT
jgi:hypothetical protein